MHNIYIIKESLIKSKDRRKCLPQMTTSKLLTSVPKSSLQSRISAISRNLTYVQLAFIERDYF